MARARSKNWLDDGLHESLDGCRCFVAARGGYSPDTMICSEDVLAGRPAPWMNYHAAERLGVGPLSSVVIVDDTPLGIAAGLAAGTWTIAVSQTGNAGLSAAEVTALPAQELASQLDQIEQEFRTCVCAFRHPLRS